MERSKLIQCGVKMKTIINPFVRKILGLDSFDKIQQNIKDYYKKWIVLVKVYDPDAGNYYDDICEYLENNECLIWISLVMMEITLSVLGYLD